jgi:hypothetical protein
MMGWFLQWLFRRPRRPAWRRTNGRRWVIPP